MVRRISDIETNFKLSLGVSIRLWISVSSQGQLLEGVECHIYLYCFTFDDITLNRAFVIIVLFPKKYSNKKVCANGNRK